MATSKAKPKSKKQADDEEDQEDNGDDEEQEDNGNKTDAQKREDAFREMVARKRGKK